MICGRVLDTSALLAFAPGTSIYASAAVWTAVDAHAIAGAHERGWPILNACPDRYARCQQTGVDLEPLP